MVSYNGTLGHSVRKIQEFTYPWPERAVLVLHTDGVSHRWDLRNYPGLQARMPVLVAGACDRLPPRSGFFGQDAYGAPGKQETLPIFERLGRNDDEASGMPY